MADLTGPFAPAPTPSLNPFSSGAPIHCSFTSTATDFRRTPTETTTRCSTRASAADGIKKPSTPAKGPVSSRTRFPASRNGQGSTGSSARIAVRIAAISPSSIGTTVFPNPTKCTTPGIFNRGSRSSGCSRQKTYPGKSGTSMVLDRSDQRWRHWYTGRKTSNPLYCAADATSFSQRDFVRRANHCCSDCLDSIF
jgi:hypothetical protein